MKKLTTSMTLTGKTTARPKKEINVNDPLNNRTNQTQPFRQILAQLKRDRAFYET